MLGPTGVGVLWAKKEILEKIWSTYRDKTIIMVSHNTKNLSYCDKVYKFENSKLLPIETDNSYLGDISERLRKDYENPEKIDLILDNKISGIGKATYFDKPNYCDVVGSILYDRSLFRINFLGKQSKSSKKRGISSFFTWLDQYI